MVAAPAFRRIAEQVLPYLDVSRDVPVNQLLVQASYKKPALDDAASLEDFTPSDLLLLPEQPEPAAAVASALRKYPRKLFRSPVSSNPASQLQRRQPIRRARFLRQDRARGHRIVFAPRPRSRPGWQQSCYRSSAGRRFASAARRSHHRSIWNACETGFGCEIRQAFQGRAFASGNETLKMGSRACRRT